MLNNKITIILLFQILFGYNIFDHTQDFKISSSSYVASNNIDKNIYNFLNPACNKSDNKFIYSSLGDHFSGILRSQQLLFTLQTPSFLSTDKLYFGVLRTSIDGIYDTSSAWNDYNQDDIVDINEIDYDRITNFSHNNFGLIISKPFYINNIKLGINTKFSIGHLLSQYSYSYSFDIGIYKGIKQINFGLVLKDFLHHSYWSTGGFNTIQPKFILGSNFNIKFINFSLDYNMSTNEYMLGSNYDYNSMVSFQLAHSTFETLYLGFLLNFPKLNFGYSIVLPKYEELGISQRIIIGIHEDFFNSF